MKRITMLSIVVLACLLLSGCTKVNFSLMGQVRNLGNQGIEGVTVQLKEEGALIGTALTSSNGIYRIESANAKKDTIVDILATFGDYSDSAQLVVVDSEDYLQDFTFPIPMGTIQIIGHVYDVDDNPIEGVNIDFLIGTRAIGKAYSDINGYFSMPGLGAVPGVTITINANFGASSTTSQVIVSEELTYIKDMLFDVQQFPIEVGIEGSIFTGKATTDPNYDGFIIDNVPDATLFAYEVDKDSSLRFLKSVSSNSTGYYDFGNLHIKEDAIIRVVITKAGYIKREIDFDSSAYLENKSIFADLHLWRLVSFTYTYKDPLKANLPVYVTIYTEQAPELAKTDYLFYQYGGLMYCIYASSFDQFGNLSFDLDVPYVST